MVLGHNDNQAPLTQVRPGPHPLLLRRENSELWFGEQGDGPVDTKLFPEPNLFSISLFRLNIYIN